MNLTNEEILKAEEYAREAAVLMDKPYDEVLFMTLDGLRYAREHGMPLDVYFELRQLNDKYDYKSNSSHR